MGDHFTGSKGPIGTDTFTAHTASVYDTWIGMSAGSNQAPEPGQRWWQNMEKSDNTITGIVAGAKRGAHTKTANINGDGLVDHIGHDVPGNDHPGIGTAFAWTIFGMIPNQGSTFGIGLDVEEQ